MEMYACCYDHVTWECMYVTVITHVTWKCTYVAMVTDVTWKCTYVAMITDVTLKLQCDMKFATFFCKWSLMLILRCVLVSSVLVRTILQCDWINFKASCFRKKIVVEFEKPNYVRYVTTWHTAPENDLCMSVWNSDYCR